VALSANNSPRPPQTPVPTLVSPHNPVPTLAPPATQANGLGVSDNLANLPNSVRDEQLQKLQQTGVTWLRKDIEWRGAERSQGHYDWSTNDPTVAAAHRFGIKTLLVVGYAPLWAAGPKQPNCTKDRCSPADTPVAVAAFGAFVGQTAKHYCHAPYNAAAIEVWNEPNLSKYWPDPNPTLYVKALKSAYAAIKATGCKITVLLGGLGDTTCAGCYSSSDFLAAVYTSGGRGLFDAVGNHPYIAGIPTAQTWQPSLLHAIMAKHDDAGKKVWATEFAYSSQMLGAAKQASYMQAAVQTFQGYPWAGPLFWFTFQDAVGSKGFGLVDPSGSPKPALDKFGELAHT
jgi:hypothetical protein